MQTTGIFGSARTALITSILPTGMTISVIGRSKRTLPSIQARLQPFRLTTLYSCFEARAEHADRVFIFDQQNRTAACDITELAVAVRRFLSRHRPQVPHRGKNRLLSMPLFPARSFPQKYSRLFAAIP